MFNSLTSKKRRLVTLETKKQIIEASANKNPKKLSEQFGLPQSTVKTILRDKAAILKAISTGAEGKRVKLRGAKHEDLEEAVLQWLKHQRSHNVPISGPLLVVRFLSLFPCLTFQY